MSASPEVDARKTFDKSNGLLVGSNEKTGSESNGFIVDKSKKDVENGIRCSDELR